MMVQDQTVLPDRNGALTLNILRDLFGEGYARGFAIKLWDGTLVPSTSGTTVFTLFVNAPWALRAAFAPPFDLSPGQAFVTKTLDVEGDLEAAIEAIEGSLDRLPKMRLPLLAAALLRLPKPPNHDGERREARLRGATHSKRRDADAIGFHYDQPIEFYRAFLDEHMVYSCAYFDTGITTLADAQIAKIDHILRKVRLAPGERLLDIGCGWGALILRAAEHFGAYAHGITLSRVQHDEAQRRIQAAGLQDRVTVELRDYRDLAGLQFDKIVSVGMVEHVGRERLEGYFHAAFRALVPGGVFLNHGIASQSRDGNGFRASGFIDRYVFPDGDLVNIDKMVRAGEAVGLEIRDVENLREHYAHTCRLWVENLERSRESVIEATNEQTYRIWKLYLAGSARNFANGRMGLFQTLFAKPLPGGAVEVPPTRRYIYP
jgi:cyclopropane-fatty-acyl-phospholipid synthase